MEQIETPRPAPYRPAERKEWIVCHEPGMAGLAILVRTSITTAEHRDLNAWYSEHVLAYQETFFALPGEERDWDDAPIQRERKLIAPYIHDWNVIGRTIEGGEIGVAAPAVNGPEAFACVTAEEYRWMVDVVLHGYLFTGKAGAWQPPSTPTGNGPEANPDAADPPPPEAPSKPRRRRN